VYPKRVFGVGGVPFPEAHTPLSELAPFARKKNRWSSTAIGGEAPNGRLRSSSAERDNRVVFHAGASRREPLFTGHPNSDDLDSYQMNGGITTDGRSASGRIGGVAA
jgi:hypothetical protein